MALMVAQGHKGRHNPSQGAGSGKEPNRILLLKVLTFLSIRSTVYIMSLQWLKKSMREAEDLQEQAASSQSWASRWVARLEKYTGGRKALTLPSGRSTSKRSRRKWDLKNLLWESQWRCLSEDSWRCLHRGKAAGDRYNGVLCEVKVKREAGEGKSKMFCGVVMQMRHCNRDSRKTTRKEVCFRSVREGKRVELVLTWARESRERIPWVCTMAAAQACRRKTPLLSCASCWTWRWSSGNSFSWKLCWKITDPLLHCSRSSLWTVSPWGQEKTGAEDALHKTGKLWEAESLVQTWGFIVAN